LIPEGKECKRILKADTESCLISASAPSFASANRINPFGLVTVPLTKDVLLETSKWHTFFLFLFFHVWEEHGTLAWAVTGSYTAVIILVLWRHLDTCLIIVEVAAMYPDYDPESLIPRILGVLLFIVFVSSAMLGILEVFGVIDLFSSSVACGHEYAPACD